MSSISSNINNKDYNVSSNDLFSTDKKIEGNRGNSNNKKVLSLSLNKTRNAKRAAIQQEASTTTIKTKIPQSV